VEYPDLERLELFDSEEGTHNDVDLGEGISSDNTSLAKREC
jgi:hypothetical protein